jgi:Uncharacterized conserved protein
MTTKKTPALAFVLAFEAKGAALYLKLARETDNPLAKKLFYSLAVEEVSHAEKADNIYQQLQGKGAAAKGCPELPPIEAVMKDFFRKAGIKGRGKGRADISGYELAMKMEREGYTAYAGFRDAAGDPIEKEFFDQMLKEEKEHLDALANVYGYLTDRDDWMQEEESKVWNWMNL